MVVANDEIDAFLLGILDFVDCLDTTIEHNYQLHAYFFGVIDTLYRDTITFFVASRYIILDIRVEIEKILIDQSDCSSAVYIIVAVDQNFLLQPHSIIKPFHSFIHILHAKRIVQL